MKVLVRGEGGFTAHADNAPAMLAMPWAMSSSWRSVVTTPLPLLWTVKRTVRSRARGNRTVACEDNRNVQWRVKSDRNVQWRARGG